MTMSLAELLSHPSFSHTRKGTGCWRDLIWIYHSDPRSPTGVSLAGSATEAEVRPYRAASPLSPTEPR